MKRLLSFFISTVIPIIVSAQTQYDYYDDSAVYGGTRRVLIGWIVILSIIGIIIVMGLIGGVIRKISYWIHPELDPEVIERKNKELEQQKQQQQQIEIAEQEAKLRSNAIPDAVDLGLSVKWASFNLGAYKPSDLGLKYKWCSIEPSAAPRFNEKPINTYFVGIISGDKDKDAATSRLGEGWRIPKSEECNELINNCIWSESEQDGVRGKLIIGPNGNSIFIPYIPFKLEPLDSGSYWTANPYDNVYQESAEYLYFNNKSVLNGAIKGILSSALLHIRPVFSDNK